MPLVVTVAFNGHDVRVVMIDGNPWFVAADVCRALGLSMSAGAVPHLRTLAEDERRIVRSRDLPKSVLGSAPTATVISEPGLYRLGGRSDKAQARAFQDWVNREVLPAIRKDGAYIMGEEKVRTGEMSDDELIASGMEAMARKLLFASIF